MNVKIHSTSRNLALLDSMIMYSIDCFNCINGRRYISHLYYICMTVYAMYYSSNTHTYFYCYYFF